MRHEVDDEREMGGERCDRATMSDEARIDERRRVNQYPVIRDGWHGAGTQPVASAETDAAS